MQIVSRIKIRVRKADEMPEGLDEILIHVWMKAEIKRTYQRRWHIQENKVDIETIIEKMFKPALEASKKHFNKDAITRSGLSMEQAMAIDQEGLEMRAKRYVETLEKEPNLKELIDDLRHKSKWYVKKMFERVIPFKGYKDMVNGAGPLAARWLIGDASVLEVIQRTHGDIGMPIDISRPGERGIFRRDLIGKVISFGNRIAKTAHHPRSLQQANEAMAEIVNKHKREDLDVSIEFVREHSDLWLVIEVRQI